MITYRIRDWSKHFENNRTRELKELRFVILPNKHDGDGYTELLDHPNGAAHYGAWVSLVQVSSKGKHPAEGCDNPAGCCECRGRLLRTGARPHDPASLSRLTRVPVKIYEEALPRLVKIEWLDALEIEVPLLQVVPEIPHPPAESKSAESRTPLRKSAASIEWNGMEENGSNTSVAQARRVFGFWQEHLNHPKSALDPKRQKAILGRLKDGYSVDDLILAVKGCKLTPHNMGENDRHQIFDDIELICRDAAHVDRFSARARQGTNGSAAKAYTAADIQRMKESQ